MTDADALVSATELYRQHAEDAIVWSKTVRDGFGLTKLTEWFAGRGVAVPREVGLLLRDWLIVEKLKRAAAAGAVPYVHLRTREAKT